MKSFLLLWGIIFISCVLMVFITTQSIKLEQQHTCLVAMEHEGWSKDSLRDINKMGWTICEFKKSHDQFKKEAKKWN